MGVDRLYQEVIMRHAGQPNNLQGLDGSGMVVEKRNPLCGDTVRLRHEHGNLLGLEARGCALCMASASILAQSVDRQGVEVVGPTQQWLEDLASTSASGEVVFGDDRDALAVVKDVRARVQCVALPWLLAREVFDHDRQ